MDQGRKNLFFYILKCVTGCLLVFFLSWLIDYKDFSWCIISVMLVLTPESGEALPLAITRIKANFIGGFASIACILPGFPLYVAITLAIIITIVACNHFSLMSGSRAAIAAVIIIMMHGEEFSQPDFWSITLQRLLAVIAGCIIGLLVTLVFNQKSTDKNMGPVKQTEA